jgi:hypothetical protein
MFPRYESFVRAENKKRLEGVSQLRRIVEGVAVNPEKEAMDDVLSDARSYFKKGFWGDIQKKDLKNLIEEYETFIDYPIISNRTYNRQKYLVDNRQKYLVDAYANITKTPIPKYDNLSKLYGIYKYGKPIAPQLVESELLRKVVVTANKNFREAEPEVYAKRKKDDISRLEKVKKAYNTFITPSELKNIDNVTKKALKNIKNEMIAERAKKELPKGKSTVPLSSKRLYSGLKTRLKQINEKVEKDAESVSKALNLIKSAVPKSFTNTKGQISKSSMNTVNNIISATKVAERKLESENKKVNDASRKVISSLRNIMRQDYSKPEMKKGVEKIASSAKKGFDMYKKKMEGENEMRLLEEQLDETLKETPFEKTTVDPYASEGAINNIGKDKETHDTRNEKIPAIAQKPTIEESNISIDDITSEQDNKKDDDLSINERNIDSRTRFSEFINSLPRGKKAIFILAVSSVLGLTGVGTIVAAIDAYLSSSDDDKDKIDAALESML